MTEAEFLKTILPDELVSHLHDSSQASYRKLRLYACACCRLVPGFMESDPDRESLELAELEADGLDEGREFGDEVWDIRWYRRDGWNAVGRAITSYQDHLWDLYDLHQAGEARREQVLRQGNEVLAQLLRDIFGNPFHPVTFFPDWRTDTATALARQMYESREFGAMSILADALQDAGCENDDILNHCRGDGPHVRGCWVVDLVLGKE